MPQRPLHLVRTRGGHGGSMHTAACILLHSRRVLRRRSASAHTVCNRVRMVRCQMAVPARRAALTRPSVEERKANALLARSWPTPMLVPPIRRILPASLHSRGERWWWVTGLRTRIACSIPLLHLLPATCRCVLLLLPIVHRIRSHAVPCHWTPHATPAASKSSRRPSKPSPGRSSVGTPRQNRHLWRTSHRRWPCLDPCQRLLGIGRDFVTLSVLDPVSHRVRMPREQVTENALRSFARSPVEIGVADPRFSKLRIGVLVDHRIHVCWNLIVCPCAHAIRHSVRMVLRKMPEATILMVAPPMIEKGEADARCRSAL
mmetsp:Transcript_31955/g.77547  ORF Transcript_31955/g.77547 Transcript_31955/m.77547 type:complete len:317 (-) Transcript_31955:418-1368(-)